ncbi:cytochrome-c peroxidase [Oceanomicrobium pacificus]|uniref:Cytochrome c domain-containing protein n=1 Tax=Oceanomicrobium pacificus TaxID=2692916 RepID=A0A6B0TKP9_9RHOB|nr:cytochrome c peroxidase [Oceanomicrobium pacificus]MXU65090.1 hypothetical protein [Oceanomicrobium pacificus]
MTGRALPALLMVLCLATGAGAEPPRLLLDPDEIAATLRHGPWPPPPPQDPSNRLSGNRDAISLGRILFTSPALSRDGATSCATCHRPDRMFQDGRATPAQARRLPRNSPALVDVAFNRWFGWDGRSDNLWSQSLLPLLNEEEMDMDFGRLKTAAGTAPWRPDYETLFGPLAYRSPEDVAIDISKALAAYQETLLSGPTPFDRFRDALAAGDLTAAAAYPEAAQRGLKLFIGRGNCALCHSGPRFTNGEFHDAAVGYFLPQGGVDPGRHRGLTLLRASPYTLDGSWSDDPDRTGAWAVRSVLDSHADFGRFRVPGLRNVARTAPYMHDGSLSTLGDVIAHYSTIDPERLHADGENILVPLGLSPADASDLEAFLRTIDSE